MHAPHDEEPEPTPGFNRKYSDRSLGYFELDHPLRVACMRISENPWFDNVILLFIMANAIVLCQMEPLKMEGRGCTGVPPSSPGGNAVIENTEALFTTVFTLECLVKVIAMGFVLDDTSYLKDGWNVMDFIVVFVSLVSLLPGMGGNVSALRVIRVLRPLRSLSMFPGMRVLIGTMIRAVPMIANVMLLCVFFFTIFGIFGLQVFRGALRNRCFTIVPETSCALDHDENEDAVFCRDVIPDRGADFNVTAAVLVSDDDEQTCTNTSLHWPGYMCPEGQMCLKANNPNYGITHFDNIAHAWLTIFQCITLEGWTPLMYMTMDALTGWTVVYFLLLVFTGGFFLLNLALAVITEVYDEENTDAKDQAADAEMEEEEAQERREQEARQKRHDLGLYTDDDLSDEEQVEDVKIDFAALEGRESQAKKICRAIIDHPYFSTTFTVLILINTLLLSMEYAGMPDDYAKGLETCNLILTISFILELVLKVVGMGATEYGKDNFNLFDAAVVLISIIELAAAGSGGLSALRAFRILRILKLIRSWTSLQNFLYTVYLTVLDLGNFSFIVFLAIFIFALLGMQLFGGKMCGLDDGDTPRHNFDTLLWALVTVFQVLTGEDWNAVMYDGMAANGSWSALYFVALLVIGNFLVLNLFIAILLINFGQQEISTEYESTRNVLESVSFFKYMSKEKKKLEKSEEELEKQRFWDELPDKAFAPRALSNWECLADIILERVWEEERIEREAEEARIAAETAAREAAIAEERAIAEGRLQRAKKGQLVSFGMESGVADGPLCGPRPGAGPKPLREFEGKSLMVFPIDHKFRVICHKIVDDKQFEWLIMAFIVISSFTMVFESPKAMENQSTADALEAVDIVFTLIFAAEMGMKLVAYGLYLEDKDSYLRDPWNCMDGFIVVIAIFGKIMSSANMGWVRALRTMRVLRPLRVISRVQELKVVVNALLNSMPGLANVLLVSLLFWVIFGILGMQLFMGSFARCDDEDVDERSKCVDGWVNGTVSMAWDSVAQECNHPSLVGLTRETCVGEFNQTEYRERSWSSDDMNFDNIFNAMQTLFEMSTTEGWTAVMYNGVDARSPELAPKRDNNPPIAFFFVAFEVVANFFILNLFVGIILDNFAQLSSETGDGGSGLMTKAQKMWVKTQRRLQSSSEPAKEDYYPEDQNRRTAYKIVEREEFEWFIMGIIVLNAITMASETYNQSASATTTLEGFGVFFAIVFVTEAALKLYAMYPNEYFADRWNCFDFFCVATTLIGYMAGSGGGASVLRVLRLARVFRLVRKLKGLQMLFNTLILSLPGLLNIGALLFLLCFVYAVLGMNLFGKVKFGENLNKDANFTNFGNSLLVLLRMVTGEAWNAIMYDCMIDSDCDSDPDCARGTCCGSAGAPMYFISFVIFGSFITLNLLIAVVLDNFSNNKKEDAVQVTEEHIADFAEAWSRVDKHATGFIPVTHLVTLLKLAGPPLGVRGSKISRLGILRFQKSLNLKVESNYLHYQDVLQAVTARAMGINMEQLPLDVQTALEIGKVRKRLVAEKELAKKAERGEDVPTLDISHGVVGAEGEELDIAQMYAVERIQAAFRGRKARRLAKEKAEREAEERARYKAETVLAHVKELMRDVEQTNERRRAGGSRGALGASLGSPGNDSAAEQSDQGDRDSARVSD